MHVVAVINQKGGVGKTTACANLGCALARRGHSVLLVDLDPQAHLSISFDRVPEPGDPSVYSLLASQQPVQEIAQSTSSERLSILPTNLDLTGAETEFAGEIGRELLLKNAFERFARSDDAPEIVILDCPPSLGLLSLNALVAADRVLLPVQAEFFALQGMAQLLDVIDRVKRRLNPRLDLLGILVGMYSRQRNLSREVLAELHEHFGELVFHTLIRINVRLAEAPSHAQTIFDYAPESGAAEDFDALAGEFERRLGLVAAQGNGHGSSTAAASAVAAEAPAADEASEAPASAPPAAPREQEAG